MDTTRGRVGRFETTGDLGWAFAVTAVMLAGTALALLAMAGFGLTRAALSCDIEGRLAGTFIVPAATAGCFLGIAAFRSVLLRAAAAIVAAVVLGGAAWWIVATVFARHC